MAEADARALPELVLIRQRYTPFGGAERFIDLAVQALLKAGLRTRVLARQWSGGPSEQPWTRLAVPHLGRSLRDAAFAWAACRWVARAGRVLVQSHERLPCCDVYRAGDGVHRAWLAHRRAVRPLWRHWLDALSPYHALQLWLERRL